MSQDKKSEQKYYGKVFQLINWDITYPEVGIAQSVVVTLEGTAPDFGQTQNINLIDIQELDSSNYPLRKYQKFGLVGQKEDITTAISNLNIERANLKTEIDNQSKIGGDLNNAIGDYDDSGTKISLAIRLLDGLTAKQYKIAMEDLEIANNEIKDGFIEVKKVKIDVVFEKAYDYRNSIETCLKNVSAIRKEYDKNEYNSINDEISKTATVLNTAGDLKSREQYDRSYALAVTAREQFNKTLVRAASFEKNSDPGLKIYILPAIIILVVICTGVSSIVSYRKYKKWKKEHEGDRQG